jgi:CHAT domain-containing protein
VEQVKTLDGVEKLLTERDEQTDILYFYAHGGFEDDEPVLTLGPRNSAFGFTAGDLEAWPGIDLTTRQPLVIVNACESAAYRPDRIENLLQGFVAKGAAGIIGTQCRVPTGLADAFIRRFFGAFFGKSTVGEALYVARMDLLKNLADESGVSVPRPDPRGLAYSLFAAADVELGQPLLS